MNNRSKRTTGNTKALRRARIRPVAAAVAAACAATSAPALAQLEEIVVTATRRAESIQDIPYNISAISSEQLESARAFNIGDVSRVVAGLNYQDQGPALRSSRNTFTLRGLNANNGLLVFGSDVSSGAVSMYFGDAPLFFPLIMKDVERVEVLRGPQGTLYGSGSLGGTVRFIPNKADFDEFSLSAIASLSSADESDDLGYGADFVLNAPLVDDTLALRLVVSFEETAGYIDGVGLVQLGADGALCRASPGTRPVDLFGLRKRMSIAVSR